MMNTRNRFALQLGEDKEDQPTQKVTIIGYERWRLFRANFIFNGSMEIANTRKCAKSSSDDSTSSQDSVLARPPIDWQKQLAFASSTETTINLTPKSSTHEGETSGFRVVAVVNTRI